MSTGTARRAPLPTGVVAFLFTDLEGSTARWDRHPEAMEAAVRRHDELLHRTMAAHGGVVFKTIGDAFCVAFARTDDAVAAAVAAQRVLGAEDFSAVGGLRARIGIHTGMADERDDDYFGPTLNRVARLCAIGHGGQVLISRVAYELAVAAGAGLETRDLGEHALKDLARPEHVYQIVADGLAREFPRLRSQTAVGETLPHYPTRFIGRRDDVDWIAKRLETARVVSLVGPGGVGKTRLAVEAARDVRARFPGGIFFVELAPLASGALVAPTLAALVGAREGSARSPAAAIASVVGERGTLVVLDNCEHVVDAVATFVTELVALAPNLRVLATTREALRMTAEIVYRVAPLDAPTAARENELPSLADLEASPAVALFMDRVRNLRADRTLEEADRAPLVSIMRRLDGLPLAIELAAGRTDVLALGDLAARLDQRFRLLAGGPRTSLPHQRTLRSLIDWSYDLLDARERTLLARLAIFAGGWTLEACEAIVAGGEIDADDVLDLLSLLHDKSLVGRDADADRFYFLDTIRSYAAERLDASGERADLARRHAAYYASIAARAETFLRTIHQDEWIDRIRADVDNLRGVLDAARNDAELTQLAMLVACGMSRHWLVTGAFSEARARFEALFALPYERDDVAARAFAGAALIALNQVAIDASVDYADRAVALATASDDAWTRAYAHAVRCLALRFSSEAAAAAYETAHAMALALDDAWLLAYAEGARAIALARSDREASVALHRSALAAARRSGDRFNIAGIALGLGHGLLASDPRQSVALLAESAALCATGNALVLASALEGLAAAALRLDAAEHAARLFGAAVRFRAESGIFATRLDPAAVRADLEATLGAARADALAAQTRALTFRDAVAFAQSVRAELAP